MLLDIQGSGYELLDPEITSNELFDGSAEVLYCAGNLSHMAIENFVSGHKCNVFCDIAGLKSLNTDYVSATKSVTGIHLFRKKVKRLLFFIEFDSYW